MVSWSSGTLIVVEIAATPVGIGVVAAPASVIATTAGGEGHQHHHHGQQPSPSLAHVVVSPSDRDGYSTTSTPGMPASIVPWIEQ